jgi:hypothetical protein
VEDVGDDSASHTGETLPGDDPAVMRHAGMCETCDNPPGGGRPVRADLPDQSKAIDKEKPDPERTRRRLWDTPVPHPKYTWTADPRMPKEWNELVSSIWAQKGSEVQGSIREPEPSEVSEPVDFKAIYEATGRPQSVARAQASRVLSQVSERSVAVTLDCLKEEPWWHQRQRRRPRKPPDQQHTQRAASIEKLQGQQQPSGCTNENISELRDNWKTEFQI